MSGPAIATIRNIRTIAAPQTAERFRRKRRLQSFQPSAGGSGFLAWGTILVAI
ncbi:hypothetical protein D3C86_2189270 [compost metagenome]